jgi:hypothetical protein
MDADGQNLQAAGLTGASQAGISGILAGKLNCKSTVFLQGIDRVNTFVSDHPVLAREIPLNTAW